MPNGFESTLRIHHKSSHDCNLELFSVLQQEVETVVSWERRHNTLTAWVLWHRSAFARQAVSNVPNALVEERPLAARRQACVCTLHLSCIAFVRLPSVLCGSRRTGSGGCGAAYMSGRRSACLFERRPRYPILVPCSSLSILERPPSVFGSDPRLGAWLAARGEVCARRWTLFNRAWEYTSSFCRGPKRGRRA